MQQEPIMIYHPFFYPLLSRCSGGPAEGLCKITSTAAEKMSVEGRAGGIWVKRAWFRKNYRRERNFTSVIWLISRPRCYQCHVCNSNGNFIRIVHFITWNSMCSTQDNIKTRAGLRCLKAVKTAKIKLWILQVWLPQLCYPFIRKFFVGVLQPDQPLRITTYIKV